jgi:hypothetical protein
MLGQDTTATPIDFSSVFGLDTGTAPQPSGTDVGSVTVPGQSNTSLDWLSQLTGAGQTLLQMDYLKQVNDINLQRAAQGLPPLNPATYAPTVNVGASPATLQAGGIGLLALIVGGVVIAAMLAKKR